MSPTRPLSAVGGSTAAWSSTDFPYMCLKDRVRTLSFRDAIRRVVRPGDVVVDAGAGTGILSFFAAAAGAERVYSVEIDPLLVELLRTSVALNDLEAVIAVVPGNAAEADLPRHVDVVVCELIETGLIEEMQVEVLNALRGRGVIGPRTRVVPEHYTTFGELVAIDDTFYGFRIATPKHEWPFYGRLDDGWHPNRIVSLTDRVPAVAVDFRQTIDPLVRGPLTLVGTDDGLANGFKLSGALRLAPGITLRDTNAMNGDKILHLDRPVRVSRGRPIVVDLAYVMGGGLGSFRFCPRGGEG